MYKILSKEERERLFGTETPETFSITLLEHADAADAKLAKLGAELKRGAKLLKDGVEIVEGLETANEKLIAFVSDLTTPPSLLAVVDLHKLAHAAQELLASLPSRQKEGAKNADRPI